MPQTLRTIVGLSETLPPLADCVLVMVDCQNTYRQGLMMLEGVEPALAEAASILARARDANCPIFHIQHDAGPGSPYDIRGNSGAISDLVFPIDGEPVIVKNLPNSFAGTDLEKQIAGTGRKDIVLAGFMTHMCINSTARGAFNLGLQPIVVASATATRPLPAADGSVIPASVLQATSLAALGDLFARIAPNGAALT